MLLRKFQNISNVFGFRKTSKICFRQSTRTPLVFESLPNFTTGRFILENFGSMKVRDILAFPQALLAHLKSMHNIINIVKEELDSC